MSDDTVNPSESATPPMGGSDVVNPWPQGAAAPTAPALQGPDTNVLSNAFKNVGGSLNQVQQSQARAFNTVFGHAPGAPASASAGTLPPMAGGSGGPPPPQISINSPSAISQTPLVTPPQITMSDRRVKKSIAPAAHEIRGFLDSFYKGIR